LIRRFAQRDWGNDDRARARVYPIRFAIRFKAPLAGGLACRGSRIDSGYGKRTGHFRPARTRGATAAAPTHIEFTGGQLIGESDLCAS